MPHVCPGERESGGVSASSPWDLCMPRSTLTEDQIRQVEQIAMRYLEKHGSINNKRRFPQRKIDQHFWVF
jgi:hypothetical protein